MGEALSNWPVRKEHRQNDARGRDRQRETERETRFVPFRSPEVLLLTNFCAGAVGAADAETAAVEAVFVWCETEGDVE